MSEPTLLVIFDADADRAAKEAEVRAILEHWPAASRPALAIESVERVITEEAGLDDASVVWMHLARTGVNAEYELIGLVTDRRLPALLTRAGDGEPAGSVLDAGVTLCPPGTPATTVVAMLRTLWNQAASLVELRREMRVLEAQRNELGSQMRRVDEELRLAAQLQKEFLPTTLPQAETLAFRIFFRPAGYVSGDIYDVTKLDEHHVGVFIADAVGHGVPAALLTMYIKRSLRTKVIDRKLDAGYRLIPPAEALATLNRDMVNQQTEQVRFATAAYALIDCRTRKGTLARAGHPPPILLRADGTTEQFEPDGSLLGVFPDETFEQVSFELEENDRLLLYSDGFETAFPSDEGQGKQNKIATDQYCREFEDLRRSGLDAALARLGERLDHQIGSLNQRDDLTMLCVAANEVPSAPTNTAPERAPEHDRRTAERAPAPSPVA